jgi:hypothetical protein
MLSSAIACGTLPQTYAFESSRSFNASYDQIWEPLTRFFAGQNIPLKTIAKDSGVIYAETLTFDDTYADCGTPPFPWVAGGRIMQLNVFISRYEGGVTATVTTTFDETRRYSTMIQVFTCNSKGKIESAVLDALQ